MADATKQESQQQEPTHPVKIYVYDLSHGMLAAMSLQMFGTFLDGLWHTSVVVYGKEYFFGQGIQAVAPGMSQAGKPHQVLDYGSTEIPQDLFEEYLHGLKDKFNATTYHLLNNNCNSFTHDAVQFLTGRDLPDNIRSLSDTFSNSPMGMMMRPYIESLFTNNSLV
eukprot:m.73311 g.73311  ORF g.73311 m.73311 type:complete len:166 (-) comp14449_c0_seq1:281-778(-)